MTVDRQPTLTAVFGPESQGDSPRQRAITSRNVFVRSQDHVALDSPAATGRRLRALEALETFGFEKLLEATEFGTAILPLSPAEPAETLRKARERLGLSPEALARRVKMSAHDILSAERVDSRTPIRTLERIAMALGLDERLIGFTPGAGGDHRLGARLKQVGTSGQSFSASLVGTFAEAAWVIRTETRLRALLGWRSRALDGCQPDTFYGSASFPTWEYGFLLAERARTVLNIDRAAAIRPLWHLVFQMGLPVIQATLPEKIAGATIASGGARGIVVNTVGQNTNVWVRRSTIAHELGHLLWDPDDRLMSVHVDEYAAITGIENTHDNVEARANAFAIEFLAPRRELELMFRTSSSDDAGLRLIMERFGVSFTAARYHVWNACDRTFRRESLQTDWAPTPDWQGTESFGDDWFPLEETSQLRRGAFAACVVAAADREVIHADTAASYLQTSIDRYQQHALAIREMFADEIAHPTLETTPAR